MPKKVLIIVVLIIAFIVTVGLPLLFSNSGTKLGTKTYQLEVADTQEARQLGLSGREELDPNAGMLFVFKDEAEQCFWMKDMNFSIDIIWLDSDKKIVNLEKNIAPKTFPNTFCASGAQYAIELNAGQIREAGISRGQVVDF